MCAACAASLGYPLTRARTRARKPVIQTPGTSGTQGRADPADPAQDLDILLGPVASMRCDGGKLRHASNNSLGICPASSGNVLCYVQIEFDMLSNPFEIRPIDLILRPQEALPMRLHSHALRMSFPRRSGAERSC